MKKLLFAPGHECVLLHRGGMSAKEKGLYIGEHGQDAYLRLPYSKPSTKK